MMSIESIANVQARIQEIQQQFAFPTALPGADFGQALDREIRRASGKAGAGAAGSKGPSADGTATVAPVGPADDAPSRDMQAARTIRMPAAPKPEAAAPASRISFGDASLEQLIETAAKKYHVDPRLVAAVAQAESGGNQAEISSAGAIGVMQLMPGTAASLGVDPYDRQQNVEGGAKFLRQMLDTFGGNVREAVAAYNAGPGAVKKYGGIPPYRETQNYVKRVMELYQ